ncbi:hypothetical protein B0T24DRAFT_248559 [Lasiosphaeria ovina]|uniref:protein-tyrosine-phosphatase n=1 Tax=Lasiosphaeria ovina TaxID=92902 RepID=A0AAE0N6X5_9PEZI|nr:hypothetical protein B0T24DRAFT_248559 [Lasiosphaeria ovina]
MPPEHRPNDRITSYIMKTSSRPLPVSTHALATHSRSNSQSLFPPKSTSTPIASPPHAPYSVGQPYPPMVSPSAPRSAAQAARPPSPNYFGLAVESGPDPRDSSLLPRENWSSPTSSVKSFAAALPKQTPIDANPDFEAFRRQVDANRGIAGFSLSTSSLTNVATQSLLAATPYGLQRPFPAIWQTHRSDSDGSFFPQAPGFVGGPPKTRDFSGRKSNVGVESPKDSAYGSRGSKRNSEASVDPPLSLLNSGISESPSQLDLPFQTSPKTDTRPTNQNGQHDTASSAPPKPEGGGTAMISPTKLRDLIENSTGADILILDVRVSPQFTQSRIKGALNLCIPTTLLKRAAFNLQKLQQTFQTDQDQERFASWRNASNLVVYDGFSSEKRDAISGMNMVKKFTDAGYTGTTNLLRGGFNAFAAAYPDLVDRTSGRSDPSLSLGASSASNGPRSSIPPIIGGVLLPNSNNNPNPFFSNIRQNQDLVDGVGQMDVGVPAGLDEDRLPRWLRDATTISDHGKKVSDKFLRIELTEQSRMKEAYSAFIPVQAGEATRENTKVQLSGIEKGGKNRYKDILPFEHARVRLQGRTEGECDYVNASYIQANRSHKRYIASQGPLPATFDDFWSVIWDQDVRVIVMLTAESEGGQLKCHQYWRGKDFGPIRLLVLSEKKVSLDIDKRQPSSQTILDFTRHASVSGAPSAESIQESPAPSHSKVEGARRRANTTTTLDSNATAPPKAGLGPQLVGAGEAPYVIIRKFALSHAAHPFSTIREITQLHYPSWPDFGAPAQPSHLLALVELANVMQRAAPPVDGSRSTGLPLVPRRGGPFGEAASPMKERDRAWRNMEGSKGSDSFSSRNWLDAPESGDQARPMLVHCSAGCGRTGAFCTVDSVIDMLKRQRLRAAKQARKRNDDRESLLSQQTSEGARAKRQALDRDMDGDILMAERGEEVDPLTMSQQPAAYFSMGDTAHPASETDRYSDDIGIDTSWFDDDSVDLIARTVEEFRGQRLSMVQSLRQFVLCYEAVLEWIRRIQDRSGNHGGRGRGRSGSLAM